MLTSQTICTVGTLKYVINVMYKKASGISMKIKMKWPRMGWFDK